MNFVWINNMISDELYSHSHICQLILKHGKGMYKSTLIRLINEITPYSIQQIKFQYLALLYYDFIEEIEGKVYTKDIINN